MEDIPASGVTPDKRAFAKTSHKVNLVYASAVPVESYCNSPSTREQKVLHTSIADAVLFAQYYGALSTAAKRAEGRKRKVFLMPLGGGVFNNSWESICKSMARAVELLSDRELGLLDIYVLTWNGSSKEQSMVRSELSRC